MTEKNQIKLNSLFAFKEGMSTLFDDQGTAVPVTILRYSPWYVSQIKTKENDGYEALQLSCELKKAKNSNKSELGIAKKLGFESGFRYVKEVRGAFASEETQLGSEVSIESLSKGDVIKVTAKSKGHGFMGSVRRWGFAGGPASHGSKFHRQPGSSGNRTWPGRVMPGKKFPGHWGDETITVKNLKVYDVIPEENVVIIRGSVPGARNTLVRLVKV
ncbi:MAG: 50S ribosomal protein L3 [Bdellovibrionales bacterium]|nr:50S ribosomal protein L3 [Bdellovibrionales bacterium]